MRLGPAFRTLRNGTGIAIYVAAMLRLEQLRAEILERLERLDRRSTQMELRIIRIEQRADDLAERLARLQFDVDAIRTLLTGELHTR
jgi:predicted  nucleic acid-binding Zn-ribbon protein